MNYFLMTSEHMISYVRNYVVKKGNKKEVYDKLLVYRNCAMLVTCIILYTVNINISRKIKFCLTKRDVFHVISQLT